MTYKKITAKGRLFFVTDIHGELNTLLSALDQLGFKEGEDTLVCAGDLIDRGRDSWKTAQHFLTDSTGSFYSVLGNHDVFAFSGDFYSWIRNGGDWAFEELSDEERYVFAHQMKDNLPYAIEVHHENKVYGVVHASVPIEFETWDYFVDCLKSGNKEIREACTWDREFVEYQNYPHYNKTLIGVDFTIHGHTPVKEPLMVGNRLHIDTGLVYGKYLTVTEVVKGKFKHHSFKLKET